MIRMLVEPSLLTPLIGIRDLQNEAVQQYLTAINERQNIAPIQCFARDGFLLVVDGHHRLAAYFVAASTAAIEVEVIGEEGLTSSTPYTAKNIFNEVKWSHVYDWEEAFSVRLLSGELESKELRTPLTIVSGPSGVGKSRLISTLRDRGASLACLKTTTTRARRPSEVDGTDYDFVDEASFKRRIALGEFAEWQSIHGSHYGSQWSLLFQDSGDALRIKDLDAFGALQLKAMYPLSVRTVFITASNFSAIEDRLSLRGDTLNSQVVRRLTRARAELALASLFDFEIVNDDLNLASELLITIARQKVRQFSLEPFYKNEAVRGTYIALKLVTDNGSTLHWKNLRQPIIPILMLPPTLPLLEGFRNLESILIAQLKGDAQDPTLIRDLIKALDHTQPQRRRIATNDTVVVFVKEIQLPSLSKYIESYDSMFSLAQSSVPQIV